MIRLMPVLALAVSLLAPPVQALTLDAMTGRWQGEGSLTLGEEPAQRFRCQVRLRQIEAGQSFFVGRCATSQAQQSFAYMLFEAADGSLRAQNSSPAIDELPVDMLGTAGGGVLRFEGLDGALFELRLDGEALRFVVAGTDRRGPARGEARLTRSE